jgi:transcriptional regulator with XRE-family HTH domain
VVSQQGDSRSGTVDGLGARVRALRRERGLTLKALGRASDLSHPFLSQLERGLARPSVASVERIARALQVPVSHRWASCSRRADARLVRSGDAHFDRRDDGTVRRLADDGQALRAHEHIGGSRRWPEQPSTAPGDVLVYVVHGAVEVDLDGTVHALAAGDSLVFDGAVPHRVRRTGGVATRTLLVMAPAAAV